MVSFALWASVPPLARSKWSLPLTRLVMRRSLGGSPLATEVYLGSPLGQVAVGGGSAWHL